MPFALQTDTSLQGTIFADKLRCFDVVDSTNTLALEAAKAGAPEGTVFAADQQSAGRGRGGHPWHSESGTGLYFSMLLRPSLPVEDTLWLSLAAGAAVHGAALDVTGIRADIRWPNDLLIGPRKFGGILAETQSGSVVVGIGVNVNHASFPSDLEPIATSLRFASGKSFDRSKLLSSILQHFDHEYRRLIADEKNRGTDLLARLPVMSTWIRGKRVHVPEQGGYEGVTAGLDERGFLLVQTAGGIRRVLSGGVRETERS